MVPGERDELKRNAKIGIERKAAIKERKKAEAKGEAAKQRQMTAQSIIGQRRNPLNR